jgi:hypothetical protein
MDGMGCRRLHVLVPMLYQRLESLGIWSFFDWVGRNGDIRDYTCCTETQEKRL